MPVHRNQYDEEFKKSVVKSVQVCGLREASLGYRF